MSKFIRHDNCPQCGSKDNLAIFDDHEHCFSQGCGYDKQYGGQRIEQREGAPDKKPIIPVGGRAVAIKDRAISSSTVQKYKVTVNQNPESHVGHVYPYFDTEGRHVANKIRLKGEKDFRCEGNWKHVGLFGHQEFPAGGLAITITEGELDALAAFELTGSRYACVSVRGASSAREDCARVLDYLSSFKKVVIAFDADEPGQKAALEVAQLFEPGQAHILKPAKYKDANEYLMNGAAKQWQDEWYKAPEYRPDGIKLGKDMWDEIVNHKDPKSVPWPWEGLNNKTYGIRQSELITITAPSGIGKTSVLKETEYSLLMHPELIAEKAGVGFLHFEEPNYDTVMGLMSINVNKPLHLPDTVRSVDELRKAYEAVIDNDRVVIWDHFGSNDINDVLAKVRHMAALGCRYIVIDHLSIIVSDQSGDERKQLDEITTKLKTLCMERDLAIICVIHQNRQGQIRGTAGVEQLSNIVISLERDKTDPNEWRRNVTKVTVEKNRFCGRTGPASYLFYNEMTGRLTELTKEEVVEYENGVGNGAGNEIAHF